MGLHDIALDEVTEADLAELVAGRIPEGLRLEYKSQLPGRTDSDKREFLADLSALANASGGDLVYGIREEDGRAAELVALEEDPDQVILRLTAIARTSIEPRVPHLEARAIPLEVGGHVLVIRVRRSWLRPHMVVYKGSSRFFARGPAGKHQLDVTELRSLFRMGAEAERRTRDFRDSRLASIISAETPVPLQGSRRFVLHLVPLSVGNLNERYDLRGFEQRVTEMRPLYSSGYSWRHNLDGFVTYGGQIQKGCSTYAQFFRNGAVESVETNLLRGGGDPPRIPSVVFEREILNGLKQFLDLQHKLGVTPPVVAMLSLLNVEGYGMAFGRSPMPELEPRLIDRRDVIGIEVLVEDFDADRQAVMKALVDPVWNATGWPESQHFTTEGEWKPS